VKQYIRQLYYLFALIFSKIVLVLPYRLAVGLGRIIGSLAYFLVKQARLTVIKNLEKSFPEKTAREIRSIALDTFRNQGKNLFELFSFPKLKESDIKRLVKVLNPQVMEKALSVKKGVLIASAHCGNWELMGAALSASGFPINVIARRIYIEGLNRMLVGFRNSKGVRVILRSGQESAREILRSLRHNEAIGMLIDQDTAVPGVFVDFFNDKAWTPSGLATLALRTGAQVILAFDIRLEDDRHEVLLSGPLSMRVTGDNEQDILFNTQLITKEIEQHIRKYPSQWVWMHNRWKTRPS